MITTYGATVTGFNHIMGMNGVVLGKPNQDYWKINSNSTNAVGIICDGCGSIEGSEFGSYFISNFLSQHLINNYSCINIDEAEIILKMLQNDLQNAILRLMGITRVPIEHFYSTIIGIYFDKINNSFFIFGLGDGVYGHLAFNKIDTKTDFIKQIGPYPNNAPPYMAYNLNNNSENFNLQLYYKYKSEADDIGYVFIGSDGVVDLMNKVDYKIPGKSEVVPPLENIIIDSKYKQNHLQRYLSQFNNYTVKFRDNKRIVENGLLPDDTTILIIKFNTTSAED